MSEPPHWSGRRSDRVALCGAVLPGQHDETRRKAAESLCPTRLPLPRPIVGGPRVSQRRLGQLADRLSDRDRAVLRSVEQWRFLTTQQLQVLHFADHATAGAGARICRRSLTRLAGNRLLDHLDRRIGGIRAGSAGFVWRLGPAGARLLRHADGDGTPRRKEPSTRFLGHCLAIADCYLQLVEWSRHSGGELLAVEAEPACWRRFLGIGGGREVLKPDLYAVTASAEYEDHWFVEVDRDTESLPTLLKKCGQYERYRRSGQEQRGGDLFPRVLWLVPHAARQHRLRAALRQTRQLDTDLFRVATADELPAVLAGGAV